MIRIDSHQHFWRYHPTKDGWITDDMAILQRDFTPEDLKPILDAHGVSGCVAIQADQSEAETLFLLELAEANPFIQAVVGWVDLRADNIGQRLEYFSQFEKLKGFRHIVQGEEDPEFLLRSAFLRGIESLGKYGYTYDILVKPHQLDATAKFLTYFPEQLFVIDHLAKPHIGKGHKEPWASHIARIATHENVYCKLSGMVTEADFKHWKPEDFTFYVRHILETFGTGRVMYGSDWPVCLLAAGYGQVIKLLESQTADLTDEEKSLLWGGNAQRFYGL